MKPFFRRVILLGCILGMSVPNVLAQKQDAPVREDYEWLDVWLPHSNSTQYPRVLLIGNSITRGYSGEVERLLDGKAYVSRLCTSKSLGDPALLEEVKLVLDQNNYDVVQFNNGLHGWGYTEEQWAAAFPKLVKVIRKHAPGAKIIWATTTPVRTGEGMQEFESRTTGRVIERNRLAAAYLEKEKDIVINDLFACVCDHVEYYAGSDGTHLVDAGYKALAAQTTEKIEALLRNADKLR